MQTLEQLPPQNIEAEESVLCSCLSDSEAVPEAVDILNPDNFYRTAHQKIFKAVKELYQEKEPVDLITISNRLRANSQIEEVGGHVYLIKLIDTVPMAVNIVHYCEIVKGESIKRQIMEQVNAIWKDCHSGRPAVGILDDAQKRLMEIKFDGFKDVSVSMQDLATSAPERYQELYQNDEKITGVPTGYQMIDMVTCGWQPSDLIIMAGRPSMGKSALAWCLARNAAKQGYCGLIFSLEMSCQQWCDRCFAGESNVNIQKFRSGRFDEFDWPKISRAGGELYKLPIIFDDTAGLSYQEIRRRTRRHKKRNNIDFVIVDHLQLIHGDKSTSRDREIGSITSGLKETAKELSIPIILLSQLNRKLEERSDKRPQLSDLRDSGNIEQDSDIVGLLYRDEFYNNDENNPNKGIAEFNIAKHRNGPTRMIKLHWNAKITKFFDLAPEAY